MEVEILNNAVVVSQKRGIRSVASAWLDEIYLQGLKNYSRSVLYDIVFDNNSADENRSLREIYWRTIETLANLE